MKLRATSHIQNDVSLIHLNSNLLRASNLAQVGCPIKFPCLNFIPFILSICLAEDAYASLCGGCCQVLPPLIEGATTYVLVNTSNSAARRNLLDIKHLHVSHAIYNGGLTRWTYSSHVRLYKWTDLLVN